MYWRTREPNTLPPTEGRPQVLLAVAINEISLDFVLESRGRLFQVAHIIREPVPLPRSHPARWLSWMSRKYIRKRYNICIACSGIIKKKRKVIAAAAGVFVWCFPLKTTILNGVFSKFYLFDLRTDFFRISTKDVELMNENISSM